MTSHIKNSAYGDDRKSHKAGQTNGESASGSMKPVAPDASLLCGTQLQGPAGCVGVEDLSAGHKILGYTDGQERAYGIVQVQVAHGITLPGFPDDEAGYPVRILKDAIADGVPARDVVLTPDHCLFFEDKFIPVSLLINRLSIFYDRSYSSYKAYAVQTEPHAVLIAESLLVASALPPCPHNRHWHTRTDMPVVTDREVVELLYYRLKARAESLGLESLFHHPDLTKDHDLKLITPKGQFISKVMEKDNVLTFMLPSDVHEVHLSSRASRPVDVIGPFTQDKRYLGVHIGDVILLDVRKHKKITAHLDNELTGWHPSESDEGRWTDGHAHLPIKGRLRNRMGMLWIQILKTIPYLETDYHGPRRKH